MSELNKVHLSSDGSHTVRSEMFNVSYHSIHGAITESNHVFIDAGLQLKADLGTDLLRIFELGFGTGLNAFLTYLYAEKYKLKIDYHAIELFPLPDDILTALNYGDILGRNNAFTLLHQLDWNTEVEVSPYFKIEKLFSDILTYPLKSGYDIIYFDAFAPNAQPELWDLPIIQKMFDSLNEEGVLVSYCAQGEFKRTLKKVGFTLESLPGPPGKREMTRATKKLG